MNGTWNSQTSNSKPYLIQGNWNANTNTPDLTSVTEEGYAWIVSTAGSTNLGGITNWALNSIAIKTLTGWAKSLPTGANWGTIQGTITDQADLQQELDLKESVANVALKQDKPASAVENNIATFDSNKDTKDSGKVFVTSISETPTDNNIPTEKAVKTKLDLKLDSNTAITPATHSKIQYDANGLVIDGTDITKSDIGLSEVDNTSDANKPISNMARAIFDGLDGNGVVSGMIISINTDTTKFNISSGSHHLILNSDIIYAGVSGITPEFLTSSNTTYIAIGPDNAIVQKAIPFTFDQRRTLTLIGVVIHSNRTTINAVNNLPDVAVSGLAQLNDLMDGIGNFNYYGNIFSPNGANLFINKSNGWIYKKGVGFSTTVNAPHIINTPALIAPSNLRYRLSTGVEYSDTASIDPNYYDLAGVRTAVPPNRFTIQRISLFPSNLIRIQYGQAHYGSKSEAIQSIATESFTAESNIAENGLLRGLLIIRRGTTNLSTSTNSQFFEIDKWGSVQSAATSGGTTTLQQAYENSIIPQITTSTALGAFSVQRGSNADTDAVSVARNGAGDIVNRINGNGTITMPKTSGLGIMIDTASPTYGWRDLLGDVVTDVAGPDAPNLVPFIGGSVREYAYTTNDKADMRYHIPHDYVPNSDIFLHVHWAHNGTAISGNVIFTFAYTYAKGHNQEVFFAEKTIQITFNTVNIATTPRWNHRITEVQLSSASPTTSQMLSSLLEVDGLVLLNMTLTTKPTITGGTSADIFISYIDLHYQSTNMPTKQKAPNFYI